MATPRLSSHVGGRDPWRWTRRRAANPEKAVVGGRTQTGTSRIRTRRSAVRLQKAHSCLANVTPSHAISTATNPAGNYYHAQAHILCCRQLPVAEVLGTGGLGDQGSISSIRPGAHRLGQRRQGTASQARTASSCVSVEVWPSTARTPASPSGDSRVRNWSATKLAGKKWPGRSSTRRIAAASLIST